MLLSYVQIKNDAIHVSLVTSGLRVIASVLLGSVERCFIKIIDFRL